VIFRGLSEFRTKDPAQLATDLQREHQAVAGALAALERERASRWLKWRRVSSTTIAGFDEAILGDVTPGNFTVQLQEAGVQDVGREVLVCLGYGSGTITVTATNGTVQGGASDSIASVPSGKGYRVYTWDGISGWWGPHSG
jgi:hypothetical protein